MISMKRKVACFLSVICIGILFSGCKWDWLPMEPESFHVNSWELQDAEELENYLDYYGMTPEDVCRIVHPNIYTLTMKELPDAAAIQILGKVDVGGLAFDDMRMLYRTDDKKIYGTQYTYKKMNPEEKDLECIFALYDFFERSYGPPITEDTSNRIVDYIPSSSQENENSVYREVWNAKNYAGFFAVLELQDYRQGENTSMCVNIFYQPDM